MSSASYAVWGLVGVAVLWLLLALLRHRKPKEDTWVPAQEIIAREHTGRHRIEFRKGVTMDTCPKCGAQILVVKSKSTGQRIALNATPDQERGTAIVMGGEARHIRGPEDWAVVKKYGFPVYRRHGETCRNPYGRSHDPHWGTETR